VRPEEKIERLEHRVRELQTAVVALIDHLELQRQIAEVERARLDEIRLSGEGEAPTTRLVELYERPRP
jgi:hypothetical protein